MPILNKMGFVSRRNLDKSFRKDRTGRPGSGCIGWHSLFGMQKGGRKTVARKRKNVSRLATSRELAHHKGPMDFYCTCSAVEKPQINLRKINQMKVAILQQKGII